MFGPEINRRFGTGQDLRPRRLLSITKSNKRLISQSVFAIEKEPDLRMRFGGPCQVWPVYRRIQESAGRRPAFSAFCVTS